MDSKFKTIIEQIIYIKENLPNQRFLQLLLNFANTQQDEECINLYFMTDKQLIEQLKKTVDLLKEDERDYYAGFKTNNSKTNKSEL